MSTTPVSAACRPRRATAVAATFLALLAGLVPLVGCGQQKPAEVAQAKVEPEPGLDPELPAIVDVGNVSDLCVDAKVDSTLTNVLAGAGAGGESLGFQGRNGATRTVLLRQGGGNQAGEAYNRQHAEQYGHFRENEFQAVTASPLSTFSTDVNTASYSNVRRFLRDGRLPPRDAVFAAEFVNYFPYSYAEPTGKDPVSITTNISQCPWQPRHHLVRVALKAKDFDKSEVPARNFVFLIDTSGSMQAPNRLPLVKESLKMLLTQLTAKDFVSIVAYAGHTAVELPSTRADNREAIITAIDNLNSSGGTNGGAGITLAYEQAKANFIPGGENRVILCTDGDFNLGITSKGELIRLIEEQRKSKVFLSVLGFGMGNYKDETLKELANNGNGSHAYIDSEREAKKIFVEQGGSLVTRAKDVKLQVEFNPRMVQAYRLIGYENRLLKAADFKNDAKDAGEMGAGHTVTGLYEVVPVGVKFELPKIDPLKYQEPAKPARGSDEWLTVKLRYKEPEGDVSKEMVHPVPASDFKADMPGDFQFAAAVAEFAMLLRDSQHKGKATYEQVIEIAEASLGNDPNGHRKEFVELVKLAKQAVPAGNPNPGLRELEGDR